MFLSWSSHIPVPCLRTAQLRVNKPVSSFSMTLHQASVGLISIIRSKMIHEPKSTSNRDFPRNEKKKYPNLYRLIGWTKPD